MYLGRIVEQGRAPRRDRAAAAPLHAGARRPRSRSRRPAAAAAASCSAASCPTPTDVPSGCRFHPRCPRRFEPCDRVDPPLIDDRRAAASAPPACCTTPPTVAVPAGAGAPAAPRRTPEASPLAACEWPTRTPGTSVIALRAPGSRRPTGPAMSRQRSALARRLPRRRRCAAAGSWSRQAARCPGAPVVEQRRVHAVAGLEAARAARVEAAAGRDVGRRRAARRRAARGAAAAGAGTGTAVDQRLRVGVRGRSITSTARPCSTIRPRYMTAIRSHSDQARLRSWVMKSSAELAPLLQVDAARRGSAPAPRRRASRPARRRSARRARARAPRRSRRAGAGRPRAGAGSGRGSAPGRGRRPRARGRTRALVLARAGTPWTRSGSATIARDPLARVQRLVRVLEDHLHPPAQLAQAALAATGSPSSATSPAAGSTSPSIARASVDLPQPDSPTTPRISPRRHSSETPSTARATCAAPRKCTARSRDLHQRVAHVAAPSRHGRCARPPATRPRARSGRRTSCPGRDLAQRRVVEAALGRVRAARAEAAALGQLAGSGGAAGDRRRQPARRRRSPAATRAAASCTGAAGSPKTVADRPRLDDPARVHDRDPVAGLGQHAEVVGDQDQRQAELLAQPLEQLRGPAPA